MNTEVRYSSVYNMLKLCRDLKNGNLNRYELAELLEHQDYILEFERYGTRVTREEFIEYFLQIPYIKTEDIENEDLKTHHRYYVDLVQNIEYFTEQAGELEKFTLEFFHKTIQTALDGLPDYLSLPDLNFIFTVGIGKSSEWVYENNIYFDFLQLANDMSFESFHATIAHEVHHFGMNMLYEKINMNSLTLKELFFLYFSGGGLAVKYCNNAEGVLSKSINNSPKNVGLDSFTWEYLNNDFYNTMAVFKNTIERINDGEISARDELEQKIVRYWMNPYTDDQDMKEVPKLKHSRIYSFGNEIWGIIHDCFGKNKVFEVLNNLQSFSYNYNLAMERLGRDEFKI